MDTQCVVVGAGAAGLAVSRLLADAGVDHAVLERDDIGHTWRTQRWDSFRLNTPHWMNASLGPVEPGTFAGREEIVRRLAERGEGLPVQVRTPAEAVEAHGRGFLVSTPGDTLRTAAVVVASGLQNVPRTPPGAARLGPRVQQLHASQYRSSAELPDGAVLVVGSGQSGCQIAEDLALAGRPVYLSTSRAGRLPWTYRGRESLAWLVESGFWDQRPSDLADPAETRRAIPVLAGGRSLDLPILARLGVRLLGRFASADGETVAFDGTPAEHAKLADAVAGRLTGLIDTFIAEHAVDAPEAEPDPGPEPLLDAPCPAELDLASAGVGAVIWCTGFTGDLSWLRLPVLDDLGQVRHDGCASPWPGVWFAGFPWLTRRRSGIFHGFTADAEEVAAGVTRALTG